MTEARQPATSSGNRAAHPLLGASLSNLVRLFSRYGRPGPGHRLEAVTFALSAIGRLPFALGDALLSGKSAPVRPPVFIIGHWRSGTTHLYNVMSKAQGLAFVSPFATALPYDFLTLTRLFGPLLEKSLPRGRYIDQVRVGPESPQEDEFAIANMTALSFLHGLYFPQRFEERFRKGLFFDGAASGEVARWKRAITKFYGKLQRERPGATLLVKNPVYTARIALLREIFPGAKFIHIHRSPYKVFFSMRNFYDQLFEALSLQQPRVAGLDAHIFATYQRMMNRCLRDSEALPKNRYLELPFAELQEKPLAALEKIYARLELGDFGEDRRAFSAYLESVKRYRKNIYRFPEQKMEEIELHWGKFIRRWGYRRPERGK